MKKVWLYWLLVLVLAVCPALAEEPAEEEAAAPMIAVAENDRLVLSLTEDLAGIVIEDKDTGVVWSSSMNDETFTGKVNAMWEKKMSSLLALNYTNLDQGLGVINNMALLSDKGYSAAYELIDNGVRVRYDLGASQIAVSVEITLDGDSVVVRLPFDSIDEYGGFNLVSVDLLPFLCSASDMAEGYFLYPDGSGAIMEFQDYAHLNESAQLFDVYGTLENQPALLEFLDQEAPVVMLPVFGMNRGDHAVLTVIEEGAETSRISLNSSSKIVGVNYMFANGQYRRGFDDLRVTARSVKVYDRQEIQTDYVIRLLFLPQGEYDYSAMARAYREYLIEREGLTPSIAPQNLAVDLFMSTTEEGLLFDTTRTVTTLEQAGEILDAMSAEGVGGMILSLKGWSRDGYGNTPDRLPISGSVGKMDALTALVDKAEQNGSIVSLTANFVEADADRHDYSRRNDIVYTGNHAVLTNEDVTTFIMSPDEIENRFRGVSSGLADTGLHGLRLERFGTALVYNYGSRRYYTVADCLGIYERMAEEVREKYGFVSVQGGSAYALPWADMLTEIPYKDSGFQFTTASVPFYQMVVHGLRDYTATPGNLSSDLEREVLRWVEMGYMPYFELTYDSTESLMYTKYQSLFTAQYTSWLDDVAAIAQQFSTGDLADLRTAQMLEHTAVARDVYKVTYDNGTTVYVNYGETDAQADDRTIPAMDYLIVKEGAQ